MLIKKYFPKRLFLRFLLIIILPVFIIQSASTYIFYQNHIQNVVRRISKDAIDKILFINKNYNKYGHFEYMNIQVSFSDGIRIRKKDIVKNLDGYRFFNQEKFFMETLLNELSEPIAIKDRGDYFEILIQKKKGVLSLKVNKKELIVKTAKTFIFWNIGLSFVFLLIAVIFMKNQLRPIKKLKTQVKNFSLNQEIEYFKPTGAKEVRELGVSLLEMEKRIKKFINQRTIILAGISHDLRTPLTRMKLELEFLEDSSSKQYLTDDIKYMEGIINHYLNFAKNVKNEDSVLINIYDYLNIILKEHQKIKQDLSLKTKNIDCNEIVSIQEVAFKRVIENVIGNALKFGSKAIVTLSKHKENIIIDIDDNGPGVEDIYLDKLSEPFFKIDKSRNIDAGGVGLGLAIAKDIVLANNGNIVFNKSKILSGLNVRIEIPSNC